REAVPLRLPRWDLRYFTRLGINGIKILPRVQLPRAPGAVVVEMLAPVFRQGPPPFYKSNILPRSFRKRCWPRRIRSRFRCARYAVALSLRDTIPNAKSKRRSIGLNCVNEFQALRNPSPPAPLFSSPAGRRCGV